MSERVDRWCSEKSRPEKSHVPFVLGEKVTKKIITQKKSLGKKITLKKSLGKTNHLVTSFSWQVDFLFRPFRHIDTSRSDDSRWSQPGKSHVPFSVEEKVTRKKNHSTKKNTRKKISLKKSLGKKITWSLDFLYRVTFYEQYV